MPFLISMFEFFWTPCLVLPVWVGWSSSSRKFCHAWRLGHFTREIALNDEYLGQFSPDRKVLWMTSEPLFEILIKFNMFDGIGAILTYVHVVRSGWGNSKLSQRTFLCLDRVDLWCWLKHFKKLDQSFDKDNSCSSIMDVQFVIRNHPFQR